MIDWINHLIGYAHGRVCLVNDPFLLMANAVGEAIIALAYIVFTVIALVAARCLPHSSLRTAIDSIGAFVFACGLTHVMRLVTLYVPLYRLEAIITLACAVVSTFTVALLLADGRIWRHIRMLAKFYRLSGSSDE